MMIGNHVSFENLGEYSNSVIIQRKDEWSWEMQNRIIANGDLTFLKRLQDLNFRIDYLLDDAASFGKLDIMKWLYFERKKKNKGKTDVGMMHAKGWAIDQARKYGYNDILKWLSTSPKKNYIK